MPALHETQYGLADQDSFSSNPRRGMHMWGLPWRWRSSWATSTKGRPSGDARHIPGTWTTALASGAVCAAFLSSRILPTKGQAVGCPLVVLCPLTVSVLPGLHPLPWVDSNVPSLQLASIHARPHTCRFAG